MNQFWKQVIINTVLKKEQEKFGKEADYTSFQLAKGFRRFMQSARRIAKDSILMGLGIISAAFGLESFLIPNKFIDGGATGMSLLSFEVTGFPLYYFIIIINAPFIFLGYKVIGKEFAIKTAIAITGLSLCIAFIHFPEVTHDKLLVAVFGGFFSWRWHWSFCKRRRSNRWHRSAGYFS